MNRNLHNQEIERKRKPALGGVHTRKTRKITPKINLARNKVEYQVYENKSLTYSYDNQFGQSVEGKSNIESLKDQLKIATSKESKKVRSNNYGTSFNGEQYSFHTEQIPIQQTGYPALLAESLSEFNAANKFRPQIFQGVKTPMVYHSQNSETSSQCSPASFNQPYYPAILAQSRADFEASIRSHPQLFQGYNTPMVFSHEPQAVKTHPRRSLQQIGYAAMLAQSQAEFDACTRSQPQVFRGFNPPLICQPINQKSTLEGLGMQHRVNLLPLVQSQKDDGIQGNSAKIKLLMRPSLPQTGYASILAQSPEQFQVAMRSRPQIFRGCKPLIYQPKVSGKALAASPQTSQNEKKNSFVDSRLSSEDTVSLTGASPIKLNQLSIFKDSAVAAHPPKKELVDFYGNQYQSTQTMLKQPLTTPPNFSTDPHKSEYKCIYPNCEQIFPTKLKQIIHAKTHPHKFFHLYAERELADNVSSYSTLEFDSNRKETPLFEKAREIKVYRKRARLYLCRFPKCNQGFQKNELLISHEKKHIGGLIHACHLCNEAFFTEIQKETHMYGHRESHKPNSLYNCRFSPCDAEFRFKEDIQGHENKHRKITPFICQFCDAKFHSLSSLQLHYTQCVPCDIYDAAFCSKRIKCAHCKIGLLNDDELVKHFHSSHFEDDTFIESNQSNLEYNDDNYTLMEKGPAQNFGSSLLKSGAFFSTNESPRPEFQTNREMSVPGQPKQKSNFL